MDKYRISFGLDMSSIEDGMVLMEKIKSLLEEMSLSFRKIEIKKVK